MDMQWLKSSTDPMSKAEKIPLNYAEAMMQDLTMHLNFFTDYIVANTTLMLSHGKIISIYDFSTSHWEHIYPERMGEAPQNGCQAYFGTSRDEVVSLTLNHIFLYNTYDVLVLFKQSYIRRLKYYSECGKMFFEKKIIFENDKVCQIFKNEDTRNYRKYGDRNTRTLFFIQTQDEEKEYQLHVSHNGSRLTKFISRIKEEWRFLEIANSTSGMLAIYNQKIGELKIYDIENHKQLLYPHELEKFVVYTCSGWYIDKTPRKFFLFHSKLFYQKDGNLC